MLSIILLDAMAVVVHVVLVIRDQVLECSGKQKTIYSITLTKYVTVVCGGLE